MSATETQEDDPEKNITLGHNTAELKKYIVEKVGEIDQVAKNRQALNDKMTELRSALEARGIPKKALDWALAYRDLNETEREAFDFAYVLVRDAIGEPVQRELFATPSVAAKGLAEANARRAGGGKGGDDDGDDPDHKEAA